MTKPTVIAVIPADSAHVFITQTVAAAARQDVTGYQVLVSDDASTAGAGEEDAGDYFLPGTRSAQRANSETDRRFGPDPGANGHRHAMLIPDEPQRPTPVAHGER